MNIGADAGFLIALHDGRDTHSEIALSYFAKLFTETTPHKLDLPWPVLYESLGTRFARRASRAADLRARFSFLQRRQRLVLLDESIHRAEALEVMLSVPPPRRALSLVDLILRALLQDLSVRIDAFITFNEGDFADVCRRKGITLLGKGDS